MNLTIEEIGPSDLARYASIPMRLTVRRAFHVEAGEDGFRLREVDVDPPYVKDYDGGPESRPVDWPRRFDVGRWGFFLALAGGAPIGGAAVAYDTPGVFMLEERTDLAVLWDLRVHPEFQRRGVGSRLFQHAASWAQGRGCQLLKIETQNVNVPACRFYTSQGCQLGAVNLHAYPDQPGEVQLLWYLNLRPQGS